MLSGSDNMQIIHTTPGDSNYHLFTELPKQLYSLNNIRLTQPENINKEYLSTCLVLTVGGEPKARAALYYNPHLSYKGKQAACIGNYECVDDAAIAQELLHHAAAKAVEAGAAYFIGPMNGSAWDNYRFSTHHNYPNFLLEPYHHLYYNQQFLEAGFKPIADYTSNLDRHVLCDSPAILKREAELKAAGVNIRSINMDDFEGELEKLYPFILEAFQNNFLYTPISWEDFRCKYLEAARLIDPEHVLLAEDREKNIIGLIFCYDDLCNLSEKSLVVKTLARNKAKEWAGLGQLLGNQLMRNVQNKGYTSLVHAFTLASGHSSVTSITFSGKVYKHYNLYGKEL